MKKQLINWNRERRWLKAKTAQKLIADARVLAALRNGSGQAIKTVVQERAL